MFSQHIQWTPLLLVVSIFACKNTHSVALGLQLGLHLNYKYNSHHTIITYKSIFKLNNLGLHHNTKGINKLELLQDI